MPENFDHYISKNIKAFYRRRLIAPIFYLLFLAILWYGYSLSDLLFPYPLNAQEEEISISPESAYRDGISYVTVTLSDLKFTGYDQSLLGHTTGYYYYTMINNVCTFVLLSPSTCDQGLPSIDSVTIYGRILHGDSHFDELLENLSEDLNWTSNGIRSHVSFYYVSEPGYNRLGNTLLFAVMAITGGYALLCVIAFCVFVFFPVLSPCCQDLALFGNPKKLLAQAEEELATQDMFITEHFFIETSVYGNAIVPIDEIIWIYKYSTLHKFFWYHFSISYTLHISANRHLYIQCPKNIKSDIDGIIDYLAEANHNILVGFNEKNRLKVQEIQGTPMHFEKFIELLKTRI